MFNEIIQKLKSLKKGTYHTIVYRHQGNGYTKTTTMVIRLVNYYNMKSTMARGKTAPSEPRKNTIVIIPHVLVYNTNTKTYLLKVHPTLNKKKAQYMCKSVYTNDHGEECSSEEYYTMSGRKQSGDSDTYQIKLEDLVSID